MKCDESNLCDHCCHRKPLRHQKDITRVLAKKNYLVLYIYGYGCNPRTACLKSILQNDLRERIYREKKVFTVYPRSSDPFCVITYYIKWVTTSWTHSMREPAL